MLLSALPPLQDDPFSISMEGIGDLCDDLDLDPTVDIRVLVLFFKLGANSKPGEISQTEWNRGCEALGLENVDDFKKVSGWDGRKRRTGGQEEPSHDCLSRTFLD